MTWPFTLRRWRVTTCHPGSIIAPRVLYEGRSRRKMRAAIAGSGLPYIENWRDRYSHYDWLIVPRHVTAIRL